MTSIEVPTHEQIINNNLEHIQGDIKSIALIGSYCIDMSLRPGSDIDMVVVVDDLKQAATTFEGNYNNDAPIVDAQGERKEVKTRLLGVPLDVTIIDAFNTPNNPLADYYENHIGWCLNAKTIYGTEPKVLFELEKKIAEYAAIKKDRLSIVESKIDLTKRKIVEQERTDLQVLSELERFIFIRECIGRNIFNRLSIKHPERSVPDFNEIYATELASCGLQLAISRTPKTSHTNKYTPISC